MVQKAAQRGVALEGVTHSVVPPETRRVHRGQRVIKPHAFVRGVELLVRTDAVRLDLLA